MVCNANTSNTEMATNFELSQATPNKSNRVSANKLNKDLSSKQSPNNFRICEAKHRSKLDNDYDSPWIGCSASKYETWLHL